MNGKESLKEIGKRVSENAWFLALPFWGWKIRIKGCGLPTILSQESVRGVELSQGVNYSEIDVPSGDTVVFSTESRVFKFFSRFRGPRRIGPRKDLAVITSVKQGNMKPDGEVEKRIGGFCRKRVKVDNGVSIRYED